MLGNVVKCCSPQQLAVTGSFACLSGSHTGYAIPTLPCHMQDCFHPKLELEGITADALLDRWCLGHGSDADTPATTSPPWKLAAQVS